MKSKNFIRRLVLPCAVVAMACLPVLAFLRNATTYLDQLQLPLTILIKNTGDNVNPKNVNRELPHVNLSNPKFTQIAANGKIAFNRVGTLSSEIFTMEADGTSQTNISNNNGSIVSCQWSPDGSKIAFVNDDNGNIDIYTMDGDGNNPTRLTTNESVDDSPSWSPDGTKIVFASDRDGKGLEIYQMNADGTNQNRLTNNSRIDYYPKFSPDGNKIAFTSHRAGNAEIWMMDANGLNAVNLTNNASDDYEPTWSPNGSLIAFTSYRSGNGEIWVMDLIGSSPVNLTNNTADDYQPAWSPDGTKIAFTSQRNENIDIYVMNSDGGNQTRLTNNASDSYFPSWQPVFYSNILGKVTYRKTSIDEAPKFVSGVRMSTNGFSPVNTDSTGIYLFSNLNVGGEYTVIPTKTGDVRSITSVDATIVLRCAAAGSNCTLTDNQKLAADTNGSNSISSVDATHILRFVAATGPNEQTGQTGNWKFNPGSMSYSPLIGSQQNQNYEAILIGEVSGNWTP